MAGFTVFTWYGKCRRLQYCKANIDAHSSDTPGRLHSTRLAWPGGTFLQVCRVWQGTVLSIAVDLSALPYLLRLILGPLLSGRP